MRYPTDTGDLHRRRLIVAGAVVLLLLIATVTYAVLVHRSPAATTTRHTNPAATTASADQSATAPATLAALAPTGDAEQFAREVADAIFTWNTTTMIGRDDHIEQLVRVGDPTGESTAGLLADLQTYLPTADAWADLTKYETKQWLTINSAVTPSKWATAQAQAGTALLPGTTAFTIRGVRHRSGIWEGSPVVSAHPVAFTVFVVCGPSYPSCHLLRLSILDKPLD